MPEFTVNPNRRDPELDAGAAVVAIQSITLQNEGRVRDVSVTEPQQPSATS